MSREGRSPPKVKVIVTQFVHTEAGDFKSVVQYMTGRDAKVPGHDAGCSNQCSGTRGGGREGVGKQTVAKVVMPKEVDRVLVDIPAWDELLRLCSD